MLGLGPKYIANQAQDATKRSDEEKRIARDAGVTGKGMKKGGKVSSASKRADGCCVKGKTKGKMV
jgi:hypothetical protein